MSPSELIEKAVVKGLVALAITDHDTVDGVPSEQPDERIEVIAGVELSACEGQSDVHVLGYFINPDHEPLNRHLASFRDYRYQRARRMVEKLNDLGVTIAFEDVLECAEGETSSIGRAHVARALVRRGQVGSVDQAFRQYLGSQAPAYVPKSKITVEEAIEIIHRAGGLAVLAHPGSLKRDECIPAFVKAGLDGIEVIHPDHNEVVQRYYRQMAENHNLVVTGGTDYHGGRPDRPDLGALHIPHRHLQTLRARLKTSGDA